MTIDRPERLNAVPVDGWADLAAAFRDFESSGGRVLVLTGAGGSFCSGADLTPGDRADRGVAAGKERMGLVADAAIALHRITKPTVAAVDGVAAGAGMNLALGCDVVVASDRARFAEIFVRRGLSIDFGGSWLLPRIVGMQRAKELALSGRIVEADEARRIGLCVDVVPPEDLAGRAGELAESFLAGAPVAQMFVKQMLDRGWEISLEDALDWEGQSQTVCFTTRDFAEGVAAFVEKRPARFEGR
jgi:2-(1,2-epoxy-1,2-dihydrophenyl)acetyl-CoA isomerase